MGERGRFVILIGIMMAIVLVTVLFTMFSLFRTAVKEESARLIETAQSQARLIEAVARYDREQSELLRPENPEYDATAATLRQIRDAHMQYEGFGATGEFTLARLEGDTIRFLLRHRHGGLEQPLTIPFNSELAEPMRRALSGRSGTMRGWDYRGANVLAAYEPVAELDLGIVAKIDMSEIRAPFLRVSVSVAIMTVLMVAVGATVFTRVSDPIINRLRTINEGLAQSERRFNVALGGSKITVFNQDRDLRYTWVFNPNPGLTVDHVIGKTDEELVPEGDAALLTEMKRRVLETGLKERGVIRFSVGGQPSFYDLTIEPLPDSTGNIVGITGASTDITELKRAEEALTRVRDELELRVAERTKELAEVNVTLRGDIAKRKQAEEHLIESEQDLRSLAAHLASSREETMIAISRDLHDELGQILTGLIMDAAWLNGKITDEQPPLKEKIESIAGELGKTVQVIKRITARLRPVILDDQGLVPALRYEVLEFERQTGIVCDFTIDPEDLTADDDHSTALYRILQESLTNIRKYARASKVVISLTAAPEQLVLQVQDDGIGITEEQKEKTGAYGILGMCERALHLGGKIKIQGTRGQGTQLSLAIPVKRKD